MINYSKIFVNNIKCVFDICQLKSLSFNVLTLLSMSNIVLKWLKLNWEVFPCKSTSNGNKKF